jgi:hypothetical protein
VYYATGSEAREPEPVGEVLIEGAPVGFDATAKPVQAGECRVFIGVRSDPFFADGELVQVDRFGNPSFNPFFVDELKNEYNAGHPADDIADYLEPWSKLLESRGYPPGVARETVLTVLPDVMHYNRNRPAHYPNGRVLTDDVYDIRMQFLTYGRVTSDGVEPHDDYMSEFPFLGQPNAQDGQAKEAFLDPAAAQPS